MARLADEAAFGSFQRIGGQQLGQPERWSRSRPCSKSAMAFFEKNIGCLPIDDGGPYNTCFERVAYNWFMCASAVATRLSRAWASTMTAACTSGAPGAGAGTPHTLPRRPPASWSRSIDGLFYFSHQTLEHLWSVRPRPRRQQALQESRASLFYYPCVATKPHCLGRYLGPMNHSVEG
jgi:hypothetical protein